MNQVEFLGIVHTFAMLSPSSVRHFTPNLLKKGMDIYSSRDIKKIIVVREGLCNNYRSHNLISPYHFWVDVHQTVSRWEACAGWAWTKCCSAELR